jgi:hypothetical protein
LGVYAGALRMVSLSDRDRRHPTAEGVKRAHRSLYTEN